MTWPAANVVRATVDVDYHELNLFDVETMADESDEEPSSHAALWEQRCASIGWGAIALALKQTGMTSVEVRLLPSAPPLDAKAEHIAECSVIAGSGRLAVAGWETSTIAGVLDVPDEPLRVRIGWFGLTHDLETEDEAHERFEVDVFPGVTGPVEVLRWWPTWVPPDRESTTEFGLRRFTGPRAEEVQATLEWIPLLFWSPYPETPDGAVSSLWRDVVTGSRWASGAGRGGHRVLRELTTDEADNLEAEGFPNVHTYAIDGDGRIWESGAMPFERTPCLNMMPRWQFDMVKGFDANRIIDLPAGWGRLIRRPRDGGGPVEVAAVDDADDAFYQRWRDDQPAPTS